MLERLDAERLRLDAHAAREAGMHMCYAVHTGVAPIFECLAGLGMDSLFGIDPVAQAMDGRTLHQHLASVTGLWMGPSSTHHIWTGPEATRQAVRDAFEIFAEPGFVLSPAVSIHSIMPWESALAMVDEWKKLR